MNECSLFIQSKQHVSVNQRFFYSFTCQATQNCTVSRNLVSLTQKLISNEDVDAIKGEVSDWICVVMRENVAEKVALPDLCCVYVCMYVCIARCINRLVDLLMY